MTDVDEELEGALHARDGALKSDPILSLSINNIVATLHVARAIRLASREATAATLLAALIQRNGITAVASTKDGEPGLEVYDSHAIRLAVHLADGLRAALRSP